MTERIIQELDGDAAKAGAELLIAYAPSRAVVYPEDWDATLRKYGMSRDDWDVDRAAAELAEICERNRIPFLDLTSDLRLAAAGLPREEKALYFERDIHWTPEGNAQVAQALARFLEGRL